MNILALVTRLALRFSTYVGKNRAFLQFFFGALALVLGLWGWSIKAPAKDWTEVLNNCFRTLQLITLHFPTSFESDVPWQLQWARLLVPLVAVSATFHVLLGGVTRPLRLAMLPHTHNHVVVFGDAQMSEAALDSLAAGARSGRRRRSPVQDRAPRNAGGARLDRGRSRSDAVVDVSSRSI